MACILNKAPILCQAVFHKNIILGSITKIKIVRNSHFTNRTTIIAENKFKIIDSIHADYKLIYREQKSIIMVINATYNCGWIGLIGSLLFGGYAIYKEPQEAKTKNTNNQIINHLTKPRVIFMIFLGLGLSVLAIIVSKTVPLRIYHNSTKKLYKAVFVSGLGKKETLTFVEGAAVPKFKHTFLADVLFDINGHTVLLDEESFPVPFQREQMIRKTS